MELTYQRLEEIYTEMTLQMSHFREELDKLKNNTTTKYVEKDTKWEGFTLETAKSYLYTSNVRLRSFGYHAYTNDAQKRNIALKDAVKYYGKECVEKKLLALICVWSTNAVHNKEYVHLLNHLQIDYAAMKSLP
jgi:hypothetical protein